MQYSDIDYSRKQGMKWLTPKLQTWLYLASISDHEPTKKLAYSRILKLRVKI